ncbi:MAG: Uma2 family endonuclease [Desulfobacterales bacterium]|nr:Uma2 family endonuclease [Desulfobacterales bacterium]
MDALQTLSRNDGEKYPKIPFAENEISEDGLPVSEEEYWEKYYNHLDFSYEWNNGYLEVKPMADHKGSLICQWFSDILRCYVSTYPVGKIVNLEIGFRLALPHKTSVRIPDMAVVLDNNPVTIFLDDCSFSGTFDLCIESLSYSGSKEIKRDTVAKKREYETVGVREYYILDARNKETAFYCLNKKGKYVKIKPVDKDIIRSGVLPGFQFRISDLYTQPSLEKLAEDEVYCKYVFPSFKEVKQRAEQAENKLILEIQRAEQAEKQLALEREKAERMAEKLKALGISLE